MIKVYFSLLFSLFVLEVFSQANNMPSGKPQKIESTKYSFKTRLTFYPFNQSGKIMLVSFDKQVDTSHSLKTTYYRPPEYIYTLPIQNDTIRFSKLVQKVSLNINQLDTLSDILYNTCFRWTIREEKKTDCYIPHNAIIFFDKNDNLLEYIEICFDCQRIKYSNKKIERFEQCDFAFADLKKYFQILGLYISEKDFESVTSSR